MKWSFIINPTAATMIYNEVKLMYSFNTNIYLTQKQYIHAP